MPATSLTHSPTARSMDIMTTASSHRATTPLPGKSAKSWCATEALGHISFSYTGSTAPRDTLKDEKSRGLKHAARKTKTGNALGAWVISGPHWTLHGLIIRQGFNEATIGPARRMLRSEMASAVSDRSARRCPQHSSKWIGVRLGVQG